MMEKFVKFEGRLGFKNIVNQCEVLKVGQGLVLYGDVESDSIIIKRRANDYQIMVFCNDGWNVDYPMLQDMPLYGLEWLFDNSYMISNTIKRKMESTNLKKAYRYLRVQSKIGGLK